MNKRPLCVALGMFVILILVFRGKLESVQDQQYQGEQKTIQCQVEEICGQGGSRSLIVSDVMENSSSLCRRMKLYQSAGPADFSELKIGNILKVTGKIYSFSQPGNPGQFDEYRYYHDRGISYKFFVQSLKKKNPAYKKIEQWLCDVRTALYENIMACLPEEEAGVAAAMILGEKSALPEETRTLYQESGIAHLLAISGLHISLIGMGIFSLLRRFVLPMKPAALITGTLLVLYGELTGFSLSAQRAVWMMLCYLAARFLGKRYDLYCALALSAFLQLLLHPAVLFQAAFLLSYGTVLGIAVFVQDFQKQVRDHKAVPCFVVLQAFTGSLGIQLVTMPVLLYYYFEINPYSVFVNLIVLPLVGILLSMSFTGSLTACISIPAGKFFFGIVHAILSLYDWITEAVQKLPLTSYITGRPAWWQIILYYGFLTLFICLTRHPHILKEQYPKRWLLPVMAVFLLLVPIPGDDRLQIINLDVGQGDCTCIRVAGKTILIDGGSSDVVQVGKYRISSYLKYYGIRKLDYVFITHSDSDHISGLMELVQEPDHMGFQIGTLVLPDVEKTDENYNEMECLCRESGILVKKMKKGDQIRIGQMQIGCLHPFREYSWRTENDYSLVLELSYGKFRGLFVGDLEQAGEEEIMGDIRDVDYLKVGHHGSAGSGSEKFLAILRPEIAVISAGEGNRYGHPSPETQERLRQIGAKVYCTIEKGAVTVRTDGGEMEIYTYKLEVSGFSL